MKTKTLLCTLLLWATCFAYAQEVAPPPPPEGGQDIQAPDQAPPEAPVPGEKDMRRPPRGPRGEGPDGEMRRPPRGPRGEGPDGEMRRPPHGPRGEGPDGEMRRPPRGPRPDRGRDFWQHPGLPREPRANISQLLKKLEQENPEEYARLCELRKNDRQAFFQEIRRLSRPQPSENSQKLFANEAECRRLAGEIRACEDAAKKQELLEQLRLKLKEAHQLAVEEFAARLNNLQQQLASMQENAEAIQEKRLQILLQEEQPEHGRPGAFPPPPPPPAGNPQDGDNPPPPPPAPEK